MFSISLIRLRRAKRRRPLWVRNTAAVMTLASAVCLAGDARAQQSDSTRCDSIVFAARRDSVRTGLYLSVISLDVETPPEQRNTMATAIGTAFVAPRPFRMSVFSGPAQMRTFRRVGADTVAELRAPTVTGVYRFVAMGNDSTARPEVIRASLIPGFDEAALDAIRSALFLRAAFAPPPGFASMALEVRIATDSTPNALKMVEAVFPRMPVIDAVPYADNPPAKLPLGVYDDSTRRFDVMLRFVVDRAGLPALETVELIRGSSLAYVREAFQVLPKQRFKPARVNGCPVAQVVSYPFAFVWPPPAVRPIRH
jgi:hypothetical protein